MYIYTVMTTDRNDYDMTFEQRKVGAFYDKSKAIQRAKETFEEIKKEYAKEMEEYSYPSDEPGALWVEEDDKYGYYCISYGEDDTYESHLVCVEDWPIEDKMEVIHDHN